MGKKDAEPMLETKCAMSSGYCAPIANP